MPRGPSRPYPGQTIEEATRVPQVIRDSNAGRPMNKVLLAGVLKLSPTSSLFRELLSASYKYEFTDGSWSADSIGLTELGERLTKPRSPDERLAALREALQKIPLFAQLLNHFNNNKLPAPEILKNTIELEPFRVTPEWSEEATQIFVASGKAVGFVRDVSGSPYVVLEAGPPTTVLREELFTAVPPRDGPSPETAPTQASESSDTTVESPIAPTAGQGRQSTLQFFIAHGKDMEALRQLQNILNELNIPYVVAQQEANVGRPISAKVKDLMDACSGGIFIFSADEEFKDKDGNSFYRPRENVIYELGAASYKYDQRIVIFKESSVTFPTDFRDLGYIEFEKGQLAGKTMDLLKELIALKAVKLLAGG